MRKTIKFNEEDESDPLEIEIYDDSIAFRADVDYDDNNFISFNWNEVKKLIKLLKKFYRKRNEV